MPKIHEVVDPSYHELVPGDPYDLIGILNCNVEVKKIEDKELVLYRVALQLGVGANTSQAIIEVWSSRIEEEPIFTRNWQNFQLVFIKGVKFVAKRERFGLTFYHFVLSVRTGSRFIWLGSDEADFWAFPIKKPVPRRCHSLLKKHRGEICPFEGIVRSSSGSVFDDSYSANARIIDSQDEFGNTTFSMFYETVLGMKRFLMSGKGKQLLSNKTDLLNITDGPLFMHM